MEDFGAETTDRLIAELMFDGKTQGITLLLERYGARISYLLNQQFSPPLTEDDLTEVLAFAGMKAFRSAHTFDEMKGNLGGWLFAIANNTAIDFIREAGDLDRTAVGLEFDPSIEGRVPAQLEDDPSPQEVRAIADMEYAIGLLPNMQKAIIRADLAAGERADDSLLATRLQSSVNSIRVQRCGAHKLIKDILTKKASRQAAIIGTRK